MEIAYGLIALVIGVAAGVILMLLIPSRRILTLEAAKTFAERLAEERLDQLEDQRRERESVEQQYHELRDQLLVRETEFKATTERLQESEKQLEKMKTELKLHFENLANQIFERKTSSFKEQSRQQISDLLAPLQDKLLQFQKKVDDSFGVQAIERNSLKEELKRIIEANREMSLQTESLTQALRGDVRAQGDWGEIVLERILEASGLREGEEYVVQGKDLKLKHVETGGALRPDVTVQLPDNKSVIIDSKVTLEPYRLYINETENPTKQRELRKFLDSLKAHASGLASKRYQDASGVNRTPDFVLMFVPIEGAYSLAMSKDPSLHSFAWEKRVAIVCPTTLFATLRTISSLWRVERQNRNAQEIAERGAKLYEKFVGFTEDLLGIGRQLELTNRSYNEALKKLRDGRGNLVSQVEKLRELGVKSGKTLPSQILGDDGEQMLDISPLLEGNQVRPHGGQK